MSRRFVLLTALLASCTTTSIHRRPGSFMPTQEDRFLILPADLRGLPGNKAALDGALFDGFSSGFKERGVSLQPLRPVLLANGLGRLSADLAGGMQHMVDEHGDYDLAADGALHGGKSEIAALAADTARACQVATKTMKLGAPAKYLAVAHVSAERPGSGGTVEFLAIAGLYNVADQRIDGVVWVRGEGAESALEGELQQVGERLGSTLLGKAAKIHAHADNPE